MTSTRFRLALVVLGVVAAACSSAPTTNDAPPAGRDAIGFEVETFESDTFALAEHRGTPVVINFWESW